MRALMVLLSDALPSSKTAWSGGWALRPFRSSTRPARSSSAWAAPLLASVAAHALFLVAATGAPARASAPAAHAAALHEVLLDDGIDEKPEPPAQPPPPEPKRSEAEPLAAPLRGAAPFSPPSPGSDARPESSASEPAGPEGPDDAHDYDDFEADGGGQVMHGEGGFSMRRGRGRGTGLGDGSGSGTGPRRPSSGRQPPPPPQSLGPSRAARELGCPAAAFPTAALRREVDKGEVQLQIDVDATGKVTSVSVLSVTGHSSFGEAARQAALGCRFEPALSKGVPVRSRFSRTARFRTR